ncbi:unnamed protein product [Agarophyton chilense]
MERDADGETVCAHDAQDADGVHGAALRSLIARLQNEPQMSVMKHHQSDTLAHLRRLAHGIHTLNTQSADQYTLVAPHFIRAARLAAHVKTDLNHISATLHSIQTKINQLRSLQQHTQQQR